MIKMAGKIMGVFGAGLVAAVIGIIIVIIGIFAMFFFAIIGAVIGAVTGFIVSIVPVLGDLVRTGFTQVFGVQSPNLTAIGAMLGFIAGFFKSVMDHKNGDNCCN
ncbi:MAG: hypothetical protein ABH854_01565 [Candidatus Diapherotrites archaeon]|nr:hypothetical protein [Candidatus Micrarchaeota archaeon]